MVDLQSTFINMFYTSLDKFCDLIDENYINKEEIKTQCKKIKKKLSYTAPEIQAHTFGYELNRITPIIPLAGTKWIDDGWKIIMDSYNEGVKITNKEYPNLDKN